MFWRPEDPFTGSEGEPIIYTPALTEGEYTCGEARALTMQHLHNVREKIKDLRRLEQALVTISSQCDGGVTQDCPILETLFLEHR